MKQDKINLFVWKSSNTRKYNPIVKLIDIESNREDYLPESNVMDLAKLFSLSLPGDTIDLFYVAIADEIRSCIDVAIHNKYFTMDDLMSRYYLENTIRIAINNLCGDNENG